MKKLNYLLLGLVTMGMVFTSCNPDEDTDKSPNLVLDGAAGFTAGDATVTVGKKIKIGVTATPNASTKEKLTSLTITRTFDNTPVIAFDSTFKKVENIAMNFELFAQTKVGDEKIVIEVTDNKGEKAQKVINLTTEAGAIDLKEFDAVIMGAQGATGASTASLLTGDTYTISGDKAKTNSAKVDIVYYFGTKEAALYAPSNTDIQGVSAYAITSWATKNATKLSETTISANDFAAIKTDKNLESTGTPTDNVVGLLAVDDVIVFETASGKKGVFQVKEIQTGASGSIKIHVKVEQ